MDEIKPTEFTPEIKLQREVEKLTEEVRVLRHPFSQPSSWIAVIALILSLGSNVWQFFNSKNEETLTKATTALAKLDNEKLAREREDLEQKRDRIKTEISDMQNQMTVLSNSLAAKIDETAKSENPKELNKAFTEIRNDINALQESTQTVKQTLNTTNPRNLTLAKDKERQGFQSLINGDYNQASSAFQEAEDAYNGYDNVYELSRLLKINKQQMSDPVKKKEVFQKIVRNYSYGAPPDLLAQVKTIANQ